MVLLFFLWAGVVRADITVAPLSIKIPVAAGKTGITSFRVINVGDEVADVRIILRDWWRTPEGKLKVLPPGTLPGSCAPWITYSHSSILLPPGEEVWVRVEIAVPEGETGDRWAMFLVAEYPPAPEGEVRAGGVVGRTWVVMTYAVKILRQDPWNASPAGEIRSVEVLQDNPLRVRILYVNTGNSYTENSGTLEVRDIFGETVFSVPIEEFSTLPGGERYAVVEAPPEVSLPAGVYYALATIDFGGEYLVQGGVMFQVPPE